MSGSIKKSIESKRETRPPTLMGKSKGDIFAMFPSKLSDVDVSLE